MGQGLVPPPPLAAHPWCCGATKDWAPRVRYLPPLPPLPSHGLVSGSQNALWALGRLPTSVRPPPPRHPPPPAWGEGRAHTRLPSRRACAVAHHPPLAPAEGAPRGAEDNNAAPTCAPGTTCTREPVRIAQVLHRVPLPHPARPCRLRRQWQGRVGVIADGRRSASPASAGAPMPMPHAGFTSATSCTGEGGGGGRSGGGGGGAPPCASPVALPSPFPVRHGGGGGGRRRL